ncbi:hypothetical protein [Streptomyces sp. NPDC058773]|uniref:hypothetical protein n=1 Tax=Streptomyces sp. NPDC058773 TaxID=3346632 RepID=UPI0036AC63F5
MLRHNSGLLKRDAAGRLAVGVLLMAVPPVLYRLGVVADSVFVVLPMPAGLWLLLHLSIRLARGVRRGVCKRGLETAVGLATVEEFIGKLHDLDGDRGVLCVFGSITAPAFSRLARAAHPQVDLYVRERPALKRPSRTPGTPDGLPQFGMLFTEGEPPVRDPAGDVPLGEEIEAGKLRCGRSSRDLPTGHPGDSSAVLPLSQGKGGRSRCATKTLSSQRT